MLRFALPVLLACSTLLPAQTTFFPLKDVRPGMRGTGRTIFSGNKIDEFQVEILGVLENIGPKESIILARLSGGPLDRTGVMEGMSGSPVYIEGKLVGAVALAFAYSKEPIAGIRPIQDMMRSEPARPASFQRPPLAFAERDLTRGLSRPVSAMAGGAELIDIATPLSFGGFTRATLDTFAPQLRALGLEPRQGMSSAGRVSTAMGDPANLKPGSMITVQLLSGDYNLGADGTVTHIDGDRVYAFGHRFLDVGATSLPFMRSDVIALVPNTNTSFKLSNPREWMGSINLDSNTAIAGQVGKRAEMAPVTIEVTHGARKVDTYSMQMVNDTLLSPLLLQMAVFSAIDATERSVGAATIGITGKVNFDNASVPIQFNNLFAGDNGSAAQASLAAATPLAYVLQSGFRTLKLKDISVQIDVSDQKREWTIDGISVSRREVKPGEKVQLNISLTGANGSETIRPVEYEVPIGADPGTLYFTVADANTTNLADFRQILTSNPRDIPQVIATVNQLHPNTKAYVRVWRADPAYQLEGVDLPDPPPSAALIFAGSQSSQAGIQQNRNSRIAEIEFDAGGALISGARTVQVEIKE